MDDLREAVKWGFKQYLTDTSYMRTDAAYYIRFEFTFPNGFQGVITKIIASNNAPVHWGIDVIMPDGVSDYQQYIARDPNIHPYIHNALKDVFNRGSNGRT
jgi:hypothetical protein